MSLVLGPIHYKMYGKVQHTASVAKALAQKFGCEEVWQQAEKEYPLAQGALEDILDLGNIHGSLSTLINNAQAQLGAVLNCLNEHAQEAVQYAAALGSEQAKAAPHADDITALWQQLERYWLDGMPCDGGCVVRTEGDTLLITLDSRMHPQAPLYLPLRSAWQAAYCAEKGFVQNRPGETQFEIRKES